MLALVTTEAVRAQESEWPKPGSYLDLRGSGLPEPPFRGHVFALEPEYIDFHADNRNRYQVRYDSVVSVLIARSFPKRQGAMVGAAAGGILGLFTGMAALGVGEAETFVDARLLMTTGIGLAIGAGIGVLGSQVFIGSWEEYPLPR